MEKSQEVLDLTENHDDGGTVATGKPSHQDSLMLHYIFIYATRHKIWDVTTLKSWIHSAKDPLLETRLKEMKGAAAQVNFVSCFPEYFEIIAHNTASLTKARIKESIKCSHCGMLAVQHIHLTPTPSKPSKTPTPSTVSTPSTPSRPSTPSKPSTPYTPSTPSKTPAPSTPPTPTPSTAPTSKTATPSKSSTPSTPSTPSKSAPSAVSTSTTTTPFTCLHDDLFRAIYFHLKSAPQGINLYSLKSILEAALRTSNQTTLALQLENMKRGEYLSHLQTFPCFAISSPHLGNTIIKLKPNFSYCPCVDVSNTVQSTAKSPSSPQCVHNDLFREIYRELSTCNSSFTMEHLKEHMIDCLKRHNKIALKGQLETMKGRSWRTMLWNHFKLDKVDAATTVVFPGPACSCLSNETSKPALPTLNSTFPPSSTFPAITSSTPITTSSAPSNSAPSPASITTTPSPRANSTTLEKSTLDLFNETSKPPTPNSTFPSSSTLPTITTLSTTPSLPSSSPLSSSTPSLLLNSSLPTAPHPSSSSISSNVGNAHKSLPSFLQKSGSRRFALIENFNHLNEAVQYIRGCEKVGVDCEGVELGKTGKLCLIQVAAQPTKNEQCTFIFDIVHLEKLPQFKEMCDLLASFLQDPNIVKVMHDARQDCSALFHQMAISVNNIYDTQVAYRALCEIKRGTTAYNTNDCERIGLNPLLQKFAFPHHPKKDQVHARMRKTGSEFWKVRPLAKDLIEYVIDDVATLLPLAEKMTQDFKAWSLKSVTELSYKYSRRHIDDPKSIPTPNCLLELTFTPEFQPLYQEVGIPESSSLSENDADFMLDEDTLSVVSLLPTSIRTRAIQKSVEVKRNLIEVVMDHERPVSLRFSDTDDIHLKEEANITDALQSLSDGIAKITGSAKPIEFMSDNRLGISKMLHRVSAMKSRSGEIIGLTYRVGRSVEGVSHMIQDIVAKVAGYDGKKPSSVLFLGRPGVGKTTVLREVSRLLAGDQFKRRVVIVDTSNEIAGDGDTPHPCIGRARRVQVPHRNEQHSVMVETVQNHNPQVIIVDEIGTTQEAEAARTISQRGVAMVGTAHGEDLHTLLKNPTLRGLIGGVQQVILSSNEAQKLNTDKFAVYKKSRLERAGAPTFDIVVELRERHKWRIHTQVAEVIDKLLANKNPIVETRMAVDKGKIHSIFSEERTKEDWFEQLKQPSP